MHQIQIVRQIVNGIQNGTQHFSITKKVVNIRAAVRLAGRAGTLLVQRSILLLETGVPDQKTAFGGKGHAVSPVPRRQDTVKKVDPLNNTGEKILRITNSHQIAGFFRRQCPQCFSNDSIADFEGFPDAKTSDTKS
jgi:hypothetical protein